MPCGSIGAFRIGLIFLSLCTSVKNAPPIGPLGDENVPPLKDSEYGASANVNSNEVTSQRHGIPKFINVEISERLKNLREELSGKWNGYKVDNYKWQHTKITYSVHQYAHYSHKMVDDVLKEAVSKWSAVTPLEFTQLVDNSDGADVKISFVNKVEFTTGGFVAACSVTPYSDGRPIKMEYSLAIPWTHLNYGDGGYNVFFGDVNNLTRVHLRQKTIAGLNVICIATHEFGHALGLLHSNVSGAIMEAKLAHRCMGLVRVELHADDIQGIQSLYGSRDGTILPRKTERDLEFERLAREWKRNRSFKNRIKNGVKSLLNLD